MAPTQSSGIEEEERTCLDDALHHVLEVGADGADAGSLVAVTHPDLDGDGLSIGSLDDVDVEVTEVTLEGAAGSLDGDEARVDGDVDCAKSSAPRTLHFLMRPKGTNTERRQNEGPEPASLVFLHLSKVDMSSSPIVITSIDHVSPFSGIWIV